jgi:hypothetical protein
MNSHLYRKFLVDLASRHERFAQSEKRGFKRSRDAVDDGSNADEEGRKLIALSTRKLRRRERCSENGLWQELLINSVIKQCGGQRRENRVIYAHPRKVLRRIKERPKRIPLIDITSELI